jgi:hypothetical protein
MVVVGALISLFMMIVGRICKLSSLLIVHVNVNAIISMMCSGNSGLLCLDGVPFM